MARKKEHVMNGLEIVEALQSITKEKHISLELAISSLEEALKQAGRKHIDYPADVGIDIDRKTGLGRGQFRAEAFNRYSEYVANKDEYAHSNTSDAKIAADKERTRIAKNVATEEKARKEEQDRIAAEKERNKKKKKTPVAKPSSVDTTPPAYTKKTPVTNPNQKEEDEQ